MKTVYLFKSPSNNISFGCDDSLGLHFIESTVDLRFLDNVVIDQRLKLQVEQNVQTEWVGKAVIWFIVLTDEPMSNLGLEKELNYVRNIGNQLFHTTKLAQEFSYSDIYTIPHVSDTWAIQDMNITVNDTGGFQEVYCLDRSSPTEQVGGATTYPANGRTVKADLAFMIGSGTFQMQGQFVHLAIPSHNVKVDASKLRVDGGLDKLEKLRNVDDYHSTRGMVLELYNKALVSGDIFTSFILLYQVVETIIRAAPATEIGKDVIAEVADILKSSELSEPDLIGRITGSLKSIKRETSLNRPGFTGDSIS